jgi:Rha family phage regulatory protein
MNELVVLKKNEIYAESQLVATVFEKRHDNVLNSIREILSTCSEDFSRLNFKESNYKARGKEYPCYHLTKDGFTMLAMGFTGEKAIQFKEMYIKRFNEMQNFITSRALIKLEFPALTDNIKQMHEEPKSYHYSNELNMINKIVLGMNAKQFKEANGIDEATSIREHLSSEQLADILELQRIDSGFVVAIPDYEERKKMLKDYYIRKKQLLLNK